MNEDQYYNPIIQAMIHTAQLQKQGQQQEIEKQKNADELKMRQETLKQAQKQFDDEHKLRTKASDIAEQHLGLQKQQYLLEQELAHVKMMAEGGDFARKGGKPGQFNVLKNLLNIPQQEATQPTNFSPASGSSQIAPISGVDVNKAFYDPTAEAANVKALAAAKGEGELPAQQALAKTHFDFNKQLQDAAHLNTREIAEITRGTQYDIAKMSRATQLAMNQNDNKTRLIVAGMGGDENSQNLVNTIKTGLATGEIKFNPTNRLHQVAYGLLQDDGWKATDPTDIKEARGMQNIEPLLGKLQKLADKLPDSPIDAAVLQGTEKVKNAFTTSKLRNDISIINSQIMNVARSTEGVTGRVLAAALKPELDSLAGITTKSNMQDRINNLRDNYVNKFNNVIFAGMPDAQKELVYKKHGLKPVESSQATQYEEVRIGPNGHELGKKNGKLYDVKTGEEYHAK